MNTIADNRTSRTAARSKSGSRKRAFRHLKLILSSLAVLLLSAMDHQAQQTPGGFTLEKYYEAPNQTQMKSRLSGAEGHPLTGRLFAIKQLKLEIFNTNGSPQAVVQAPDCIYDMQNGMANSAGHLLLQSGDGKISTEGDGFLWRQDDSFLTISNHVHTVIKTGPEAKGLL